MAAHLATSSILDPVAVSPWARTLWQGFIVDALVAIGLGLTILMTSADISSPAFWGAVGVLVGKSFLTSIASWLTRLKVGTPRG